MSEPATLPAPDTADEVRTIPPYHVILHNDDHHTFAFVVQVLRQVFGVTMEQAFQLTLQAHEAGRAICWTGPQEVAELKAEQIATYHEVRERDGHKLGPVSASVEPAA